MIDSTRTEDELRHALELPPGSDAQVRLAGLVRSLAASDATEPAETQGADEVLPLVPIHARRHPSRHASRVLLVAATVLVLVLGAVIALATDRTTARNTGPAADPSHATPSSVRSTTKPTAVERVGDLIRTDVPYQSGKLTFWIGRDRMGGLTLSGGNVRNGELLPSFVSESGLLDHGTGPVPCGAPTELDVGFHCGQDAGGLDADHHIWLIVGYVVGDVSTVRITVDGKVHAASTAAWSQDSSVHVYWAPGPIRAKYPPKGSPVGTVGAMVARDANGKVVARAYGAVTHG